MKVFIASDMEGATGVTHGEQTHHGGQDYERARTWLTADVNAAVEGAFAGGADAVRISDGHGNMRNLLLDEIDPRVEVVSGTGLERELCQLETLDETFDALFLLAFHAQAGTPDGVLAHTWIGGIVQAFRLAGRVVGETGIAAATAGAFGVPVALVTGDAACCRQAKELLGGVETAEVKRGLGNRVAVCKPPAATGQIIRDAAAAAVKKAKDLEPFRVETPLEIAIRFSSGTLARQAARGEGVERVEEDTVAVTRPTVREAVAAAWRLCYIAALEQGAFAKW